MAAARHQQPKNDVEVVVSRPAKFGAKISHKGTLAREMIYDGKTFTVIDGSNNFYSKAAHRGTLDSAVAQMTKIYGSLPRRLKATKTGSAGRDLLVDVDFLTWEMNPQANASIFRHQPASGATEIPMVTLDEANQTRR